MGQVAKIITKAVQDVAGAVGGFATEVYEIRDAAKKASDEHVEPRVARRGGTARRDADRR